MQARDELNKNTSTSTTVNDCLKKYRDQNPNQDKNCTRPENHDEIFKQNESEPVGLLPSSSRGIIKPKISTVVSQRRQDCASSDDGYEPPIEPPPLPEFKSISKRVLIDINDILEYPGRSKRPERILILIRGASGSGKSFLANLIQDRELKMGNNRIKIHSMNHYYQNQFDKSQLDKFNERLLHDLRNTIREEICNFIIVECEGGRTLYMNKYIHCGITLGHFKCYCIEIRQPFEVCKKYNRNGRSDKDIADTISDLDKHPPLSKMNLLDSTSLLLDPQQQKKITKPQFKELNDVESLAKELSTLLNKSHVKEFLFSQFGNQSEIDSNLNNQVVIETAVSFEHSIICEQTNPSASKDKTFIKKIENLKYNFVQPPFYDDCPTFYAPKIIKYNHVYLPTNDDKILEFKVYLMFDHNHEPNDKLKKIVNDIDIEKIIEKRRNDALNKKVLRCLRMADRPEDTVSNPKYPNNWEIVGEYRSAPKSKRAKRITQKIERVLEKSANSWHL